MPYGSGKSKKLVIYQDKKTRAIFLHPTTYKNGKFVIKQPPRDNGAAKSNSISDSELGKAVRKTLNECD